MTNKSCSTCIFYHDYSSGGKECRRYPPSIPSAFPGADPVHPGVEPNDWCGEFKSEQTKRKKKEPSPSVGKEPMNRLIREYLGNFNSIYGITPVLNAADRVAAKRMIQDLGIDDSIIIVKKFLKNPPRWNRENKTMALRFIPAAITSMAHVTSGDATSDVMDFLKTQSDNRDKSRWFEYVDYVKKSCNKVTYEEWSK